MFIEIQGYLVNLNKVKVFLKKDITSSCFDIVGVLDDDYIVIANYKTKIERDTKYEHLKEFLFEEICSKDNPRCILMD